MKLSDIKGDRTFDVIADIIGPITNIAQDDEAMEIFSSKEVPDGMTKRQFLAKRISKSAPALLKNHKQDIIDILSAIDGVSADEYAEGLSIGKLIGDMIEIMTDEAILSFLPQSKGEEESSVSV